MRETRIKCDKHRMRISESTGKLSTGGTVLYHERHGSPCDSQTFERAEVTTVSRETAEAELIRIRLEARR